MLRVTFVLLIAILLLDEALYCLGRTAMSAFDSYSIVSVLPRNSKDAQYLLELEKQNMIQLWNDAVDDEQEVLLQVDKKDVKKLRQLLCENGMESSIIVRNIERDESCDKEGVNNELSEGAYDFGKYHTFDSIADFLKSITKENRKLSRLITIGETFEKRPLYAIEISTKPVWRKRKKLNSLVKGNPTRSKGKRRGKEARKIIMMDCGMHSREWISIAFCVYFINKLITGYKKDKSATCAIEKYDFMIMPVINPDGYVYTHEEDRIWRKNRVKYSSYPNCTGVDINRNFNFSVPDADPCTITYNGPQPLSERSSKSINRLLRKTSGSVKAYFSIHSFGQLWLIPWTENKALPRNYKEMKRVGEIGIKAIAKIHGTKFKVGSASNLLYVANGTLLDYVYDSGYANYSFTLELRDKGKYGFLLPSNQILQSCEETTAGVLAAVDALK